MNISLNLAAAPRHAPPVPGLRCLARPAAALLTACLLAALATGCGGSGGGGGAIDSGSVLDRTPASRVGTLDAAFSTGSADGLPAGVAGLSLSAGKDYLRAMALQADGKAVVAGIARAPDGTANAAVARFNTDGTPDAGFGIGGVASVSLGRGDDTARAVAVQPDGKIVVAGTTQGADGLSDIAALRLNSDGTPDATFGTGGVFRLSLGEGDDTASAVAIQPDGKIVLAGTSEADSGLNRIAVARLNRNGTLDAGFGGAGTAGFPAGVVGLTLGAGDAAASALALQPDGRLVVVGTLQSADGSSDMAVARLNPDGTLDAGFGAGGAGGLPAGVAAISLGARDDTPYAVALQPNGRIVLAGTSYTGEGASRIAVVRLNASGTLDATFGAGSADGTPDGAVGLGLGVPPGSGAGQDTAYALALQPDGMLVVAGTTLAADGSRNIAVARLKADGTPDTTFGPGTADGTPSGAVGLSLGAGDDIARAVALQPDGRILVAGDRANGAGSDIWLARLIDR